MDHQHSETPEMDRLRAEIGTLRDRLAETARLVESRSLGTLLAETPLADHDYRLAREAQIRIQGRLQELESCLGAMVLELEGRARLSAHEAG